MKRHRLAQVILGISFLAGITRADSTGEERNPCDRPSAWNEFNGLELNVTSSAGPEYATWRQQFDRDSNDIQVDVEINDGRETLRGKIRLVGGRVMAVQGPITNPGAELGALDEPVLWRKIVTSLLRRSVDGPGGPLGLRKIDFTDEKTGIQCATPRAQSNYAAPWHVRGEVNAISATRIDFDLILTFADPDASSNNPQSMDQRLVGRFTKVMNARIADTMSFEGWSLFKCGGGPVTSTYRSVGDIRKELADDDFPGELDTTKDFTGFWKRNCENPFGLQIMRYGTDGKYSVGFCGPGGCDTPGSGRSTFLTKDRHYIVVSESEIRVRTTKGWAEYHRCTKETHPVLRYKEQGDWR